MEIRCPYCDFPIVLTGIRAGHFTPRCPRCADRFDLTVRDEASVVVRPLSAGDLLARSVPADASAVGVTVAPPHASVRAQATAPPPAATRVPKVPAVDRTPSTMRPVPADPPPPAVLGGYSIANKLGQGGMGSVYRARQLSLDRPVALKVLSPGLAADASLVARFTREAYAAALLSHHNVVQVYDIGEDQGVYFYSMECVEVDSLAGVLERDGQLAPETAVGYALQAARGLKFAHDQGLVHRDVKPANLLINDQGMVKVADLGLVKKRGTAELKRSGIGKLERVQSASQTGFDMSMGTPAYMSPEQARDAATVDARADVYSLGCTLYDLLTGHPPFTGRTAMEVIGKHASEPVTPPELVSRRVPPDLSAVLMRMVAKRPDERYADMGGCIAAMEEFLGVEPAGPFTPKEQHASAMERAAKTFHDDKLARARRAVVPGFFLACLAIAAGAAVLGTTVAARVTWAGASLGLMGLTAGAYVVMAGITGRHAVFRKVRQLAYGASAFDWIKALMVGSAAVLLIVAFNLQWVWIAMAIAAGGLAAALHFGLEPLLADRRRPLLTKTEELLRTLRFKGLDEESVRQFTCKYAGHHWEEFYEALFGYEAKLAARKRWGIGLRGRPRPRFAAWRDVVIAWIDGRLGARTADRQRRVLALAEEQKLIQVEGMEQSAARFEAKRQALKTVNKAARLKRAMDNPRDAPEGVQRKKPSYTTDADRRNAATAGPTSAAPKPSGNWFDDAPDTAEDSQPGYQHQTWRQRRHGGPIDMVLGGTTRFPLSVALVAVFLVWFHQANPNFARNAGDVAASAIEQAHDSLSGATRLAERPSPIGGARPVQPLSCNGDVWLPGMPDAVRHALSGYPVGIAGGALLISCLFVGRWVGAMNLIGVAVILLGGRYLPDWRGFRSVELAEYAGGAICLLGIIFGRS